MLHFLLELMFRAVVDSFKVTENGAVNLYGKTLQERAKLIISIADPSAQEELDKAAFERFGSHFHFVTK